ncbi:hypothetical protein [Bacillus gaemokensis]|nr:hypothetical protein [Bacillus gaemokensis]
MLILETTEKVYFNKEIIALYYYLQISGYKIINYHFFIIYT